MIRESTEVVRTQSLADIAVIQSQAQSTAQITLARAAATAIRLLNNATAQAYSDLKSSLGYSNVELLQHVYIDTVRQKTNANLFVGSAEPVLTV